MKLMKIFENRTVLGITCIVLSLFICFVLSPIISRTNTKSIKVVRAVTDIKSGEQITKNMVSEISMSSINQPESIYENIDDVIGKYATMDMIRGDTILNKKISDVPHTENTYLNGLDGNKRAISISIKSLAIGVSGKLKSGDVVSIIAPNYKKMGATVIPRELQYVEVIAATGKSGIDMDYYVDTDGKNDKELPATVTLLASEQQCKLLAELEAEGDLHLSLVYRGTRETAEKFLMAQDELNGSEVVIDDQN